MKSFPFYRQLDQMDCGATCLRMICAYHGKIYPLEWLRQKCGITRQGASFTGMMDAAEELGLKSLGLSVSMETLIKDVPLPCIVHWRQRHFVVVHKIGKKHIYVADPAFGKVKYSHARFLEGWLYNKKTRREQDNEGYVLLLEPTPEFAGSEPEPPGSRTGLSFLFPYIKQHKKLLVQLLAGVLLSSLLLLAFPFLTRVLVDQGIRYSSKRFVQLILIGQLMVFVSQTLLEIIRRWTILFISKRVNISAISDFLARMMRLPLSFFDSKMTTDLIQRVEDQRLVEQFLSNTSLNVLFSMINILLFGGILLHYNSRLFLFFCCGSFLYFVWVLLFVKRRATLAYLRRDELAENRSSVLQIINGIHEIKLNNSERKRRREWESIQARAYHTASKELRLEQFQVVGGNFIMQCTYIIITFISAISVIEKEVSLGMMLATQYIIGQLSGPINNFVSFIQGAQEARISIRRMGEIVREKAENSSGELPGIYEPADPIVLENLSFRYGGPSSPLILKNISLEIPRGKVLAIVGASGSGKTTLMKLLLKFYNQTGGHIRIGNQRFDSLSPTWWRSQCGVVMQDGFIFADTIVRNISESDAGYIIDKERLRNAVRIANIEKMIDHLPLGYNTNLSWGGISLSGGENQRVLIARAVYKNPEFIFLDEATSSLDANNEMTIMSNLNEFFVGRTVVIIAHRLSTVKNADKIVVLDQGTIIEEGSHEELVALNGSYFRLIKNQLELGN
jgi:ATP-binding cassette, subfamily B, bacterial